MPVLPNPDPQVWRMLLGDRAGEILGRNDETEAIPSSPEDSPTETPSAGKFPDRAVKGRGNPEDRQDRDAGES